MIIPSLLYRDPPPHDANTLAENSETLIADLNLDRLFSAMSAGDPFLYRVAKEALLQRAEVGAADILYRQEVLSDCLENQEMTRTIYRHVTECLDEYRVYQKNCLPSFSTFIAASSVVKDAISLLRILLRGIDKLIQIICAPEAHFTSVGVKQYIDEFCAFFSHEFLSAAMEELAEIESSLMDSFACISAGLGGGLKANNYILEAICDNAGWRSKSTNIRSREIGLYSIGIQAQAGALRDVGLTRISRMLKEIGEKTAGYLESFRYDLGFYVGCSHLYRSLQEAGVTVCYPCPMDKHDRFLAFQCLVDCSLALENRHTPIGNSTGMEDFRLILVTGANQGGKSTFLRSVGCAQLMMQCGMFVCADAFSASCCSKLFTHFCRSESSEQNEGRLHEELNRINEIVNACDPDSVVLMNESFSSTSEHEASCIADEIVQAFFDCGVRTIYVTHFYEFARKMQEKALSGTNYLVAQRNEDGTRPYILVQDSPRPTSYGIDIFNEVFSF